MKTWKSPKPLKCVKHSKLFKIMKPQRSATGAPPARASKFEGQVDTDVCGDMSCNDVTGRSHSQTQRRGSGGSLGREREEWHRKEDSKIKYIGLPRVI